MTLVRKNEQLFYLAAVAAIITAAMVIVTGQGANGQQFETAKASEQSVQQAMPSEMHDSMQMNETY